ncbi:hypothetical protein V5N11_005676 [Cardamine amara subsp. amara]|uniref:Late embryogenesis abundant protein LEA-2 subgroup domain-containing protein n=1 Tax=Cardamine amara subsp. amara TaxID=228776 RepID=A0ABD0YZB1_CARAN
MEHEEEVEPLTCTGKILCCCSFVYIVCFWAGLTYFVVMPNDDPGLHRLPPLDRPVPPEIELASMDFTVFNITQTHLSAKWDMSIRIPYNLPRDYICLQGDLQASLLFKNIPIATSSSQKYNNLKYRSAQLLNVSVVVSDEDIGGLIWKAIMEGVKEKKEVIFGSQFFLTDCRKNKAEVMSFACHEATLRFEHGSEMKATLFGNHSTCINY